MECCNTFFSFNFLSIINFVACCTSTDSNILQWKDLGSDHNISLSLKSSPNIELLVNQFNSAIPENSNDPENLNIRSMKCIALKCLTKIDGYPCSI